MKDKKGQDLSITTIILVVLGIAVLVILIIGFTQGWNVFGSWFGSKDNRQTIADQCLVACESAKIGSSAGFCNVKRIIRDGTNEVNATCNEATKDLIVTAEVKEGEIIKTPAVTIKKFVDACPGVTCG